ncbi:hypothetical protein Bca101_008662 [Brassica carinata]
MGESGAITIVCNHCDRDIPAPNIDLHRVHCANLEKCNICGDMVPKKHAEEHFLNTHAQFVMQFVDNDETKCPGTRRNTRGGGAQGDGNQRRRLFFTVAATGIAVLMGSLFFQKKR